ncbi:uncharacterized protein LOC143021662 [Oratosquilla oratoria]|uniref:uncharacterized protein LOC143021662 n=1 Tax=Oratosquilla oratoria TaxID=337810 RepID=UPI003F759232
MEREGVFNYITKGKRLFQQFAVDNFVKVESNKLSFLELHQNQIRKDRADILNVTNKNNIGQRVVLPPTFVGGPRYMKQRQQDALAYVSYYGSPDYFITFTMNPNWSELRKGMNKTGSTETKSCDRPDLVSRIFKLKVDSLIEDLTHKHIFGRVKEYLYSIEWQKRGLPHVHVLLWMEERVTADIVSQLISAEIPDKEKEPRLYHVVTKCMIHGPCKGYDESHLCCQGKHSRAQKCGKGFPKTCRNDLLFGNNGYPEYKRRSVGEGGNSLEIKIKGEKKTIDNSWVVPYNAYLCLKYNAHINVECSNSIKCIAYVTKYVNKGCDRILFTKTSDNGDVNEVENDQEARFVNPNEATWKIFKFEIHKNYPPVTTLDLHLEGENEVFYNDNTSYVIRRSSHKAVKALGLLADEETWKNTILEIINHTNDRKQLRETYASMLVFSDFEDQSGIWEETKDLFASDYLHIKNLTECNDEIYLDTLDDIQKHVWNCGEGKHH